MKSGRPLIGSGIGQRILNGDGGGWIRGALTREAIFQLSRYHVYQRCTRKIRDKKAQKRSGNCMILTGRRKCWNILRTSVENQIDSGRQRAQELYQYLNHNKRRPSAYD